MKIFPKLLHVVVFSKNTLKMEKRTTATCNVKRVLKICGAKKKKKKNKNKKTERGEKRRRILALEVFCRNLYCKTPLRSSASSI